MKALISDIAKHSINVNVRVWSDWATAKLGERLRVVKSQEEQARRRAAYDVAAAERDKLAAELAEVYPPFAEKLADLAARIAANDAVIGRINCKLPRGRRGSPARS